MAVYNSIQLDLCKKNSYKAIPTKQLDTNSRFLRVELLNNGSQYDFNDDVTVILASTRNGETKAYKCTVEDGCVVAPLTSWMLAEEGYVDCEIVLVDTASNSKLSSFAFSICVDESIYNDETISQDENYNVLLQLITEVDTAVKSCNTATEKATEIYNTVETKLNNGELKGEKGDKGDTYELTAQDKQDIVNQIPNASPSERGIMSVPWGCGILVDENGSASVYYPITSVKSTTDDIKIVKHTGGSTDGQYDLTFNSEKYAQKSELPTKTSELQNDSNFVSDKNYIHTDSNFTKEEKDKLGALANYDDTAIKEQITNKQDKLTAEQLENISAVPNKIDNSQVGNGLKFADGVLSLNSPAFKFINEVTVTADNQEILSNYPYVFVDTDSNGQPFELDEMFVEIKLPAVMPKATDWYTKLNSRTDGIWTGIRVNANIYTIQCHIYKIKSDDAILAWVSDSTTYNQNQYRTYYASTNQKATNTEKAITKFDKLKCFGIGIPYQTAITQIPLGTVIKIWGKKYE